MKELKEQGLPIMRQTNCKVGAHAFIYTGEKPSPDLRCDCGLYAIREKVKP